MGHRQGGPGLGVTRSARTARQGRGVGPGISAILDGVKRRRESTLVPRPRQALDGAQYGGTQPTDISRINRRSYWSRSCPAASSSRNESVTNVAVYDPAACADRCGVWPARRPGQRSLTRRQYREPSRPVDHDKTGVSGGNYFGQVEVISTLISAAAVHDPSRRRLQES